MMNREFTIVIDKRHDRVINYLSNISSQIDFSDVESSINFVKGALICMVGQAEKIDDDVQIKFNVVHEE